MYGKNDVIPLLPLLGVNYRQPLLQMYRILVYPFTTDELINQSSIGYMINPTLHVSKVFREQVEKCLRYTFHKNTMESINKFMRENDTYVIVLEIFYETKKIQ